MPLALLGVMLAISGPSVLIAWMKLRQRSLGPILDASGWAINGRMKINLPLGRSLSQQAQAPSNAERSLREPVCAKIQRSMVVGLGRRAVGAGRGVEPRRAQSLAAAALAASSPREHSRNSAAPAGAAQLPPPSKQPHSRMR